MGVPPPERIVKTMTIRNIPAEPAQSLDRERRKRGALLNGTVLPLSRNALGVPNQAVRSNGLRQLAGAWSEAEYKHSSANKRHLDRRHGRPRWHLDRQRCQTRVRYAL